MKKKHRFLSILISVILLAAVSLIAVTLITGGGKLSFDGFRRLLGTAAGTPAASSFSFESGFNSVFADMDGCFAVASAVGLQVFDAGGNKTYTEIYEMANPTVVTSGRIGAAYDLGGRFLIIFDAAGILGSMKTDGSIISASLSGDGWLTLCTQAGGGYKAYVSVYKIGTYDFEKYDFRWKSGGGYILSAALSPDNRSLAVLTLNEAGSRIVFFSLDSTEEKGSCTLSGKLAMDIRFIDSSHVLAVCSDVLVNAGMDGKSQVLADYSDKYLTDYSVDGGGFTALVVSDYMVGDQGRILTVDPDGKTLGTLELRRRIVSVSTRGEYLAVLYGDGIVIYDKNLKECANDSDTAGAVRTMMRSDGTALLITSHSASVFSIQKG